MKRDGSPVVHYSYDTRNLTTGATFGNGVELTNQHDELGHMTDREYNKDGNMIVGFSYDYDEVGNKLYQEDLRDPDQSELYGYDSRDRLTDWERCELNDDKDGIVTMQADQTWNLDPVGNWDETAFDGVTETRDHNDVNELTHRENGITADLKYDDNGNLIEDDEYEYAYDAFNRLVEVADRETGDTIATYRYDTQNRRVRKEVTNSSGLNGTTEYVYDGWQVVEERDGSGNAEKTYTYGSYIDEPVTMTNVGSTGSPTYYYHTNNLYNVRALTDKDGEVVERYQYSAYGAPTILDPDGTERKKSVAGNAYMFQGRRHDAETGLYYYRNRYYSAKLGRFVTRDPKGYVDGWNLYEFVGGRVIVFADPFGLNDCEIIGFADEEGWNLTKVTIVIDSGFQSGRGTLNAFAEEAEGEWKATVEIEKECEVSTAERVYTATAREDWNTFDPHTGPINVPSPRGWWEAFGEIIARVIQGELRERSVTQPPEYVPDEVLEALEEEAPHRPDQGDWTGTDPCEESSWWFW